MQNFRPFPQWVLLEMFGNPTFDLFHLVKVVPKGGKSTDGDHNLTSSEGSQDTSACKISGYSLLAFSGKCSETSPDGGTDMPQNGHGWSDPCTGGKRVFQADGQTTQKHNASGA